MVAKNQPWCLYPRHGALSHNARMSGTKCEWFHRHLEHRFVCSCLTKSSAEQRVSMQSLRCGGLFRLLTVHNAHLDIVCTCRCGACKNLKSSFNSGNSESKEIEKLAESFNMVRLVTWIFEIFDIWSIVIRVDSSSMNAAVRFPKQTPHSFDGTTNGIHWFCEICFDPQSFLLWLMICTLDSRYKRFSHTTPW